MSSCAEGTWRRITSSESIAASGVYSSRATSTHSSAAGGGSDRASDRASDRGSSADGRRPLG